MIAALLFIHAGFTAFVLLIMEIDGEQYATDTVLLLLVVFNAALFFLEMVAVGGLTKNETNRFKRRE